jgi:hypothetical protein
MNSACPCACARVPLKVSMVRPSPPGKVPVSSVGNAAEHATVLTNLNFTDPGPVLTRFLPEIFTIRGEPDGIVVVGICSNFVSHEPSRRNLELGIRAGAEFCSK